MDENFYLPPSQKSLQSVHEIQFECFSADKVRKYSVCEVKEAVTLVNKLFVRGGLSDLRMGSTNPDFSCETCHMHPIECTGHFGHLELAEPMFNIGFFDYTVQCLRSVCKSCSRLLLSDDAKQTLKTCNNKGSARLIAVQKECHGKKICPHCNYLQPNIGRYQTIYPGLVLRCVQLDTNTEKRWYGIDAYSVLDKIIDQDATFMGFNVRHSHPRDLLLSVLPIPPPAVRPSVSYGTEVSENELTSKLLAIIRINNRLGRYIRDREPSGTIEEMKVKLQGELASYFNNASTYYKPVNVSQTSKQRLKSIYERLKLKSGRLRGNLMGKRVNFSARTVITGDPNIDVDEVGVPYSIVMTLTVPERVNCFNRRRLTETVRRTHYPTANAIVNPEGKIFRLSAMKPEFREKLTLEIGAIVERQVVNGDVVLFNRQPTLHRMSMMGHRVRVLHFNTFRLNLSCTTPYNADFDGDEMNLHVPQSLLTKAELIEMMMVPKNFVSPNRSAPCMGIVQDSLLGSFRITDKDVFLDKYFVQNLALWLDIYDLPIPAILKPRPLWTGKQIFSLVLPDVTRVNVKIRFSHDDDSLIIRQGRLISGRITKGVIGASAGSFIHIIFNEKGSDEVAKFINGVQRLTTYFLYTSSFSVGIQDAIVESTVLDKVADEVNKAQSKVKRIGAQANEKKLERKAGMTLLQSFEAEVNVVLNTCREVASKHVLQSVSRRNSFKNMIDAGSKGSALNIYQIAAVVGQQNVYGSRIPFYFRRRTLPHFMLDDYGEVSRGLVNRGYIQGLRPHEFFFHTVGGREGLIDTAVKTGETGYLQRKLMKAMEDLHCAYDGTVRNANQEVVQFIYGEDGLDGARIEGDQKMDIIFMSNKQMEQTFKYEYNEEGNFAADLGGNYLKPAVKAELQRDPTNLDVLEREWNRLLEARDNARNWIKVVPQMTMVLPVNVERVIREAQQVMGRRSETSDLNPVDVIRKVEVLISNLKSYFASSGRSSNGVFKNFNSAERVENALKIFTLHLQNLLASRRVVKEYRLDTVNFNYVLNHIRRKFMQSLVQPGEMVGAITAQSCGEPATQMTLNTFHNAGISSKNVTLGVPRLKELLSASRNQKNSSMTIALRSPWDKKRSDTADKKAPSVERAMQLAEYATLETIVQSVQIIYDPEPYNTFIEEDRAMLELEQTLEDDIGDDDVDKQAMQYSPWVIRIKIKGELAYDKDIDQKDVKQAIRRYGKTPEEFHVVADVGSGTGPRIIRVRRKLAPETEMEGIGVLKKIIPLMLKSIPLRGIPGITKVFTTEIPEFTVDPVTGAIPKEGVKVGILDTEGTALRAVFRDFVDSNGQPIYEFSGTSSNNIPEIFECFGIEAARQKFFAEIRSVYVNYSVNINARHYSMLVDTMCHGGYLMAISRTGVNRSNTGPLMRCSFEETVGVLMKAAAFGESDPMKGVSANIMLGNQPKIGTGMFDLMLDVGKLTRAFPQEEVLKGARGANPYQSANSVHIESNELPGFQSNDTALHSQSISNASSVNYGYDNASGRGSSITSHGTHGTIGGGAASIIYSSIYPTGVMEGLQVGQVPDAVARRSQKRGLFDEPDVGAGGEGGFGAQSIYSGTSAFQPMDLYSGASADMSDIYNLRGFGYDSNRDDRADVVPSVAYASVASSFGLQSSVAPYATSLYNAPHTGLEGGSDFIADLYSNSRCAPSISASSLSHHSEFVPEEDS